MVLDGFNVDTHIVDTVLRLQQAVLDLMGDGMPTSTLKPPSTAT